MSEQLSGIGSELTPVYDDTGLVIAGYLDTEDVNTEDNIEDPKPMDLNQM